MLDLNLNFLTQDDINDSGTSSSSVVNADGFISSNAVDGEGDGEEDSVGAGESFSGFNFDILKVGGAEASNSCDEVVTRRLFPVSEGEESGRLVQANSLLLWPNGNELQEMRVVQVQQQKPNVQVGKKSRRGPRSKSSQYRGVTFYRRTGRWESHIWDCGKQVYLGGFDTAHSAARAYDRAAIKFRGVDADINFNLSDYEEDMKQTMNFSKEDFVQILRRQSTGFPRGGSKYRGVMTLQKSGGWEARMGPFLGKKAYDKAAMECNGREAVNNFEANTCEGNILPTIHHGNDHNLNLSLGISAPSLGAGSSRNENLVQTRLDYMHSNPRLQLENPVLTLKGPPLTSGHFPSWSHAYPTFVPNYEESATTSRVMAGPSQGPPYWGRSLHDHNQIPAASSGFSAPSGSHHLRDTISMAPIYSHNSRLSTATTSSQYYYQIKPPPPP